MDETHLKKFRNLISSCPKVRPWRDQQGSERNAVLALTADFLRLAAGGPDDVTALLDEVLTPRQRDELPAIGDVGDDNGVKRLSKLNTLLKKSPPLKPWTIRGKKDSSVRKD